jgi:homoserine kinase
MGRCLVDVVAEPYRKALIPCFEEVQKIALEHGALGCGISGSGPSIFALCKGKENAYQVKKQLNEFYTQTSLAFDIHLAKICKLGTNKA